MKRHLGKMIVWALILTCVTLAANAAEKQAKNAPSEITAETVVEAPITGSAYPAITLEVGKPVTLNFQADATQLNGCNNEILIPDFDIDKQLAVGDNYVTLTPTAVGEYSYSCWMNMIQGKIYVVEAGTAEPGAQAPQASESSAFRCIMQSNNDGSSSCCGR